MHVETTGFLNYLLKTNFFKVFIAWSVLCVFWWSQEKQHLDISTYQNVLADTIQMYEKKVAELMNQLEEESLRTSRAEDQLLSLKKLLSDQEIAIQVGRNKEMPHLFLVQVVE